MIRETISQKLSGEDHKMEPTTLSIYKRVIGSIIDIIIILLFLCLSGLIIGLLFSPYEFPGQLGADFGLFLHSPIIPIEEISLDLFLKILFMGSLYSLCFYVPEGSRLKASVGKYLLGGVLLKSTKEIIDNAFSRFVARTTIFSFCIFSFSWMRFPSLLAITLSTLMNGLPVLFTRQSLLDLMTGTIYARRKKQRYISKE